MYCILRVQYLAEIDFTTNWCGFELAYLWMHLFLYTFSWHLGMYMYFMAFSDVHVLDSTEATFRQKYVTFKV